MRTFDHNRRISVDAFTLIELIVVTATVALILFLNLPTFAAASHEAKGAICLDNKLQLIRAWQLFTSDNDERFPGNIHGGLAQGTNPNATTYSPAANAFQ